MLYLCKSSATIVKNLIMNTEIRSPKLKSATTVVLFSGAAVLSILSQCSSIPLLVLAAMFVSIAVIAFLCIAHLSFLPMLAIAPAAVISFFLYDSILSALNILLIPITATAVIYSYRYKLKRTWIDIAIASTFGVTLFVLAVLSICSVYGKLNLGIISDLYSSYRSSTIEALTEFYVDTETGETLVTAELASAAFDYTMLLSPAVIISAFTVIGHIISGIVNVFIRLFSLDKDYLSFEMVRLMPSKASAIIFLVSYLFALLFGSLVSEPIYMIAQNLSTILTLPFVCVGFSLAKSYFVWRREVKGLGIGSIIIIILLVSNILFLLPALALLGAIFIIIGDRIKLVKIHDKPSNDDSNQ